MEIDIGLMNIKNKIKEESFETKQQKINELNNRASSFVEEYISNNSQYDIKVYQVRL